MRIKRVLVVTEEGGTYEFGPSQVTRIEVSVPHNTTMPRFTNDGLDVEYHAHLSIDQCIRMKLELRIDPPREEYIEQSNKQIGST